MKRAGPYERIHGEKSDLLHELSSQIKKKKLDIWRAEKISKKYKSSARVVTLILSVRERTK